MTNKPKIPSTFFGLEFWCEVNCEPEFQEKNSLPGAKRLFSKYFGSNARCPLFPEVDSLPGELVSEIEVIRRKLDKDECTVSCKGMLDR